MKPSFPGFISSIMAATLHPAHRIASVSNSATAASHLAPPVVAGSVLSLLRLEGLAVVALTTVLYARTGAPWWMFAALWLVPDLSMLGYRAGFCWGARIYNAIHSYTTPIALAVSSILLHTAAPLPFALIWANHIAVDRLLGYGLKYQAGFGFTHLGRHGGA